MNLPGAPVPFPPIDPDREDATRAVLDGMATATERKVWVLDRYRDGEMGAAEVAFWFYVYGLGGA